MSPNDQYKSESIGGDGFPTVARLARLDETSGDGDREKNDVCYERDDGSSPRAGRRRDESRGHVRRAGVRLRRRRRGVEYVVGRRRHAGRCRYSVVGVRFGRFPRGGIGSD
eukprot:3621282-Pleurochrysis_carterae.AAC.1